MTVPAGRLHEARQRLSNHPLIGACGYNFVESTHALPDDPALADATNRSWGLHRIGAPRAWDRNVTGGAIGVVDSGLFLAHEEVAGRVRNAYSYATRSPVMQSGIMDHGTHVAVTAAGTANNGRGTAGVSPASAIIPVQALHQVAGATAPGATAWEINDAIGRAMDAGATVVNLSLGPKYATDPLVTAWKSATDPAKRAALEQQILARTAQLLDSYKSTLDSAQRRRVVLCKSAGNDGVPARFDPLCSSGRAIVVAATDAQDARATFSNYGPYTTVSAPGVEIYSAVESGDGYGYQSGTSQATPHVSGLVALMKGIRPQLTFEEVRDVLIATGRTLSTDLPIGPLVNAPAALDETERRVRENVPQPTPEPPLISQPAPPPAIAAPRGPSVLDGPEPWKDPAVQRLIDLYLSTAIPAGKDPAERWFFDKYGRLINPRSMRWDLPPDYAADRYRVIWENARRFQSTNLGTLFDFVTRRIPSS